MAGATPDPPATAVSSTEETKQKPAVPQPRLQTEFDSMFQYNRPRKPALVKRLTQRRCRPGATAMSFFPILHWLPRYQRSDLLPDIVSGLTVAVMHLPQGMAYALLASVSPIVGLYMAFFPVLLYITMGTSRHISMGTFAVVCMMASKAVVRHSAGGEASETVSGNASLANHSPDVSAPSHVYQPIEVATALCLCAGLWQVLLGVCRLGVLSVFLSSVLVSAFTTGAAIQVLTSQIKNLFGIQTPRHSGPLKIVYMWIDLVQYIQTSNPVSIAISAAFIVTLTFYNEIIKPRLGKKIPVPVPIELLAVIIGTVLSIVFDLKDTHHVNTINDIPTGLPNPTLPPVELLPKLLVDGLLIAIVAFSVNMSMAKIFARKLNYSIDANQELLASGFSNILGSFFSCLPFAASLSRSYIQQTVGGRTQIASLVSCMSLLLVLLVLGPQFEPLPYCVLASIVVVSLKGLLVQVLEFPTIWRHSRADGLVWMATFLSVIFIDIDYGLFIGIALSLASVLLMGQQPKMRCLGQVPGTDIYLDFTRYQAAVEVSKICIIHISGGLHFANADYVSKKLYRLIKNGSGNNAACDESAVKVVGNGDAMLKPVLEEEKCPSNHVDSETVISLLSTKSSKPQLLCVILDMSSVCFVDPSSLRNIETIHEDLKSKNIVLCLAESSAQVYETMVHCDFFWKFPDTHLFATVHDAVMYAQQMPL